MSDLPGASTERFTISGAVETLGELASESELQRARLEERKGAVVLLSGGLDSATTLAIARSNGFDCYALSVDYGQRHAVELDRARDLAMYMGASHRQVRVDLRGFGGSALTDDDIVVPYPQAPAQIGSQIPATYVPARNTILLSLALAWAETLGAQHLYIGANVRDYSGYPDCRPEFLRAFEKLANLGTRAGDDGKRFSVVAPLLSKTKADIIRWAAMLEVPFELTHSCYDPDSTGRACGLCEACILRRQGFRDAEVEDPTIYAG